MNETRQTVREASNFYMEVVDDDMAAVLRQKSCQERLQIADRMWRGARSVIKASLQSLHPHWTDEDINRGIAQRILGEHYPDVAD